MIGSLSASEVEILRFAQDDKSLFGDKQASVRRHFYFSQGYRRLMQEATQAAPKPLSILTTVTLEAQELSMPSSAATPPKLAP